MSWFSRAALSLMILTIASAGIVEVAIAQSSMDFTISSPSPENRDKLIQELNLTPQQIQQLKAVRQEFKGQKQSLRQALTVAEKELANLMINNASAEQVQSKRNQIKTLKQKLAIVKARNNNALRKILTTEQWAKLQSLRAQRLSGK